MKQIVVQMRDKLSREERFQTIDISVIYEDNGTCWQVASDPTKQHKLLEAWMSDAHEDKFILIGWRIKS